MFGRFLGFSPETSEDRRRLPQLHPGTPTVKVSWLFTFLSINAPAEAHRALSGCCRSGALAEWYCTRLESERPKGLGGSNPSRSVKKDKASEVERFRRLWYSWDLCEGENPGSSRGA